jgi:hypothetical protein
MHGTHSIPLLPPIAPSLAPPRRGRPWRSPRRPPLSPPSTHPRADRGSRRRSLVVLEAQPHQHASCRDGSFEKGKQRSLLSRSGDSWALGVRRQVLRRSPATSLAGPEVWPVGAGRRVDRPPSMGNAGSARPINPQQAQGRHREGSFPPAGFSPDADAQ